MTNLPKMIKKQLTPLIIASTHAHVKRKLAQQEHVFDLL